MKKITFEQLKENILESYTETLLEENNVTSIKDLDPEFEGKEVQDELDKLKLELDVYHNIREISPIFDDERFSSWDVISMLEHCLHTCVEEGLDKS